MKKWIFLAAIAFCLSATSLSLAGTTGWMYGDQLRALIDTNLHGKAYGTAIECKEDRGVMLRLTYVPFVPFSGVPPIYRWQWVFGKSSDLDKIIAGIRLKGKPQRKYKVVQKHSFLAANGDEMTCAILHR